jgi:2-polyprenyl-3-methyl-5-hydroxy-6-metoxy-1,4-benzoquinol methylase
MREFLITSRFAPSNRIRRQEIEFVMNDLCIHKDTRILEIGCGSGLQSTFLSEESSAVVSSDVVFEQPKFEKLCLVKCCGEHLPFKSASFDIVYSSNVLEHIKDRSLALRETGRVLDKQGILACVVPTSTWKILELVLYYPKMIGLMIIEVRQGKLANIFRSNRNTRKSQHRTTSSLRSIVPGVHGEFKGNTEEIIAYRKRNWVHLLESNGFCVYKTRKLLLYAPLGTKLRAKDITILPPSLRLEKITSLCSSISLYAVLK